MPEALRVACLVTKAIHHTTYGTLGGGLHARLWHAILVGCTADAAGAPSRVCHPSMLGAQPAGCPLPAVLGGAVRRVRRVWLCSRRGQRPGADQVLPAANTACWSTVATAACE